MKQEDFLAGFSRSLQDWKVNNIHIEPTTRCNLNCQMCPRSISKNQYGFGDMDFSVFEDFVDALPESVFVHLNGVGESLLHPRFLDMVAMLKTLHHPVGFTTNGTLLWPKVSQRLVALGLDYIVVSLDGASKATYERIRHGANFERVTGNIRNLCQLASGQPYRTMHVGIKFVLQLDNFHEASEMILLACKLGVQTLEISIVEMFHSKDLSLLPYDPYYKRNLAEDVHIELERARSLARQLEKDGNPLKVVFRSEYVSDTPICCHTPERDLFVSFTGKIAPCPVLAHGVPKLDSAFEEGDILQFWLGEYSTNGWQVVWHTEKYQGFMEDLVSHRVPAACLDCMLLRWQA